MNYLSVENLGKSFGSRILFKGLSFGLAQGEKTALIARNGVGKTTLLNILSRREAADEGEVTYRKGLRVAFLPQEPDLPEGSSILDAVLDVDNPQTAALIDYEHALQNMADQAAYQKAFERMERLQAWDLEDQTRQTLGRLGLHNTSLLVDQLSGGQRKRVALARTLLARPDLLILDEPTNHLDLDMIEWLEEFLSQKSLTLLMVTHDRYFLESVCDHILELSDGELFHHPGNYSDYLRRKAEREEVESTNVSKAQNLMRKELEWIRRQPKARGTKSKARVDNFQNLKTAASKGTPEGELRLQVKMTRLGSKIVELHKLHKHFGDLTILKGFNYTFKKGEKIGIVGPNGVGKSTFLRLLTGAVKPDGGKVVIGETVRFGFYTQSGLQFKDEQKVIDVVRDIAEYIPLEGKGGDLSASQLLERFLFSRAQQHDFVAKLSGGEKRRLYLLTILMDNPNFLILDEPTNDLDLLTLNVLEDFLLAYQGCLIVVTHDRYFMDKLTDHLFVFTGDGSIRDFPGNYSEYRRALELEEETNRLRNQVRKSPAPKSPKAPAEKAKTSLTYAERLEIEALEKELPSLEEKRNQLTKDLEASATDPEALQRLGSELEELQTELEAKEMRWLELSEYL